MKVSPKNLESNVESGGMGKKASNDYIGLIEKELNLEWYEITYAADIENMRYRNESTLEFYLRIGARIGHDPNDSFSEILYRYYNSDVMIHVRNNLDSFGFRHYIEYGNAEPSRIKYTFREASNARLVLQSVDRGFLKETYGPQSNSYPDIVDFYFSKVREDLLSPSRDFSEAGYFYLNPDVENEVKPGKLLSGFEHFLLTRGKELRAIISHEDYISKLNKDREDAADRENHLALEASLPGITHLSAFDMLNAMEFFDGAVDVSVKPATGTKGLLVMVPHFLPEILFGGYMAFYDFLARLKNSTGIQLHLLVVNMGSKEVHANNLLRMRLKMPSIHQLFSSFQRFDSLKRKIDIPQDFQVMSYCCELHPMASRISKRIGKKPIFFIQEFEPDFHANNDNRSFSERSFLLPHHAVYNSGKLVEFFQKETEVFDRAGVDYRFSSIENSISCLPMNRESYLKMQRTKLSRRLIMYGRPEGHAARNHFATLVFALRQATRSGIFGHEAWEFVAVGSLSFKETIDLNGSSKLKMMPKMPKGQYEDFLLSGDIGVSVITTPHPGIVHFQMASYGLATITNRTTLRDDVWLAEQNRNLVPIDMTIDSIIEGFQKALIKSEDFDSRYENALAAKRPDAEACLHSALNMVTEILNG